MGEDRSWDSSRDSTDSLQCEEEEEDAKAGSEGPNPALSTSPHQTQPSTTRGFTGNPL